MGTFRIVIHYEWMRIMLQISTYYEYVPTNIVISVSLSLFIEFRETWDLILLTLFKQYYCH